VEISVRIASVFVGRVYSADKNGFFFLKFGPKTFENMTIGTCGHENTSTYN
jgi:hypothetical protein